MLVSDVLIIKAYPEVFESRIAGQREIVNSQQLNLVFYLKVYAIEQPTETMYLYLNTDHHHQYLVIIFIIIIQICKC